MEAVCLCSSSSNIAYMSAEGGGLQQGGDDEDDGGPAGAVQWPARHAGERARDGRQEGAGRGGQDRRGPDCQVSKCRQFSSIFVLIRALGGNPTDGEMDAMTSKLKENKKYDTIVTIGVISTPVCNVAAPLPCPTWWRLWRSVSTTMTRRAWGMPLKYVWLDSNDGKCALFDQPCFC